MPVRRPHLLALAILVAEPSCVDEHWGWFGELELDILATQLGPITGPATNDPTNRYAGDQAAAALGQAFFFERSYSVGGQVSCATCHDPSSGFQDARANTSFGIAYTTRHAPSCLFSGEATDEGGTGWQFWDGRRDSLWSQALGPPENEVEMGGSRSAVAYMIYDRHRERYEAVFGAMPALRDEQGAARFPTDAKPGMPAWEQLPASDRDAITNVYVAFGKSIDAYERQLVSLDSPFDRFWADAMAGDIDESTALTPSQKRGLRLFIGKANCIACHYGPDLSDGAFHNTGVAQLGPHIPAVDEGRAAGVALALSAEFNCASRWSDQPDKSLCAVATLEAGDDDVGAFKTPSLRDVALTAPYMHTGTIADLDSVVRFYDAGGAGDGFSGTLDADILPLGLSEIEIADLVSFLDSLTGAPLPVELTVTPGSP